MNQFMVNGVEKVLEFNPSWHFYELLQHLRKSMNSDSVLISSVKIDGIEVTPNNEKQFADLTLEQISRLEVMTTHPRELAEDTLQALIGFTNRLSELSRGISQKIETKNYYADLLRLIDGLEIVAESISVVKNILHLGFQPSLDALEKELIFVLQDIVQSKQNGDEASLKELLFTDLPKNLDSWVCVGIPHLIRSRDS